MSLMTIRNLSFCLPHKNCFLDFSATINPHSRIGIIGRNGNGKSTLLKLLASQLSPTSGEIITYRQLQIGYLPQFPTTDNARSGGQQLFAHLTDLLDQNPDLLLLDEPTNHLDHYHRQQLFELLTAFAGAIVVVSHDPQLLNSLVTEIWSIENDRISTFRGQYNDLVAQNKLQAQTLTKKISQLERAQADQTQQARQEQQRFARSQQKGQKDIINHRRSRIAAGGLKSAAQNTHATKQQQLSQKSAALQAELDQIYLPSPIKPRFLIPLTTTTDQQLLAVRAGQVSYAQNPTQIILSQLNFTLNSTDRISLQGNNGSGKTTFLKALLRDPAVVCQGTWQLPTREQIGYLDQHYALLPPHQTLLTTLEAVTPQLTSPQRRAFLADFLFYTNEQVNILNRDLSGGEKVRLLLALICAQPPQLLILDEITNNLDLETKDYLLQVLNLYPGALIVVSHDQSFLDQLNLTAAYRFSRQQLQLIS